MGELFKNTYTIDDMLDRMGVKIVLDGTGMTEEEREEAERTATPWKSFQTTRKRNNAAGRLSEGPAFSA